MGNLSTEQEAVSMLDQNTIQTIKSTVPVLQEYGEQITTRFYQLMFADHPELYNIFNIVHQKKKEQQKALASAVYQAADHIDRLADILPAVERIFQKHRSLGVKAEHYPIVGKYLLLAIRDVLGGLATDEIMNAWERAYGELASIFISKEQELYQQTETQAGGWDGWREFVVRKKVQESRVITSFYLYPVDGKALPSFEPGQYISIKAHINDLHLDQIRQYSLSDAPNLNYYRISVKREDAGAGHPAGIMSNHLHREVQEGDIVTISAPAGDFYLDRTKNTPVVFISGGVGLTPMMSMLNTLIQDNSKRTITTIHAAINSEYHALQDHVEQLAEKYSQVTSYICYEKPTELDRRKRNFDKEGYIDLPWLRKVLPTIDETDFYFCGPIPFMAAIKSALEDLGVKEEHIHYEFFGPASILEANPVGV